MLVRRAVRRFSTRHGQVHILHEVPGVPDFRDFEPPIELRLGDIVVPVASLADMRRMKERAARPKDRIDLVELDALGDSDGEG